MNLRSVLKNRFLQASFDIITHKNLRNPSRVRLQALALSIQEIAKLQEEFVGSLDKENAA